MTKIPAPINPNGAVLSSVQTRQMVRNNNLQTPLIRNQSNFNNTPSSSLLRRNYDLPRIPQSMMLENHLPRAPIYQSLERPNPRPPHPTRPTLASLSSSFYKGARTIAKRGKNAIMHKLASRRGDMHQDDRIPLLYDSDSSSSVGSLSFTENQRASMSRNQFERLAALGRSRMKQLPSSAQMWGGIKKFAKKHQRPLLLAGVTLGSALVGTLASIPAMVKSKYNDPAAPVEVTHTSSIYGSGGGGGVVGGGGGGGVVVVEEGVVVVITVITINQPRQQVAAVVAAAAALNPKARDHQRNNKKLSN